MLANELCPAPHIEASDLPKAGRTVTIKRFDFHDVGEDKERKGVVFFEEFSRAMVLNRTNVKRIIAWHGEEADDWVGKQITLDAEKCDFGGRIVPCIRVREKE